MIDARAYVADLFVHLLGRSPKAEETAVWLDLMARGMPEREVFHKFISCREYLARTRVAPGWPSGHFYSPVVDPAAVRDYWTRSHSLTAEQLVGLKIDKGQMKAFWSSNLPCIKSAPFSDTPGGSTRYFYSDGRYPKGDAIVLMAMINAYRPARIIEIGSGFSSAVMLDTADHLLLAHFDLLCIDPYADRLRSLLREQDRDRVRIIEQQVQSVSLETFLDLEDGDFLFIDSSHILKTGSDVHYELFSILPALKPGVIVHFHDIQFPFEYPSEWIFNKRWSWNEIYAVRAFLMYNRHFNIEFFTDYFIKEYPDLIADAGFGLAGFVGGSLWIKTL